MTDFAPGYRVRCTEAFKAELARHSYYSEREDGGEGTIRAMVTPTVADVRFDNSAWAGGRLLHVQNIEPIVELVSF